MQSTIYEMGKDCKMVKIDETQHNNLKRGQVLHWGGNMGAPACDYVIVEKVKGFEDRINYKCIKLKPKYEPEAEYKPYVRTIEAYSIKKADNPDLWHSQHHFITDKTIPEAEINILETKAFMIQEAESKARAEAEAKAEQNKKRFNKDNRLIKISLCFDNSDSMTDYYNPCSTAERWILAEIPQGKRLLSYLKREISKYKGLNALKWTEHKEKWSMNHFGYSLTSETVNIKDYIKKDIKRYLGGTVKKGFFMVDFGSISYDGGADDWIEKPIKEPEIKTNSKEITLKRNLDKNGIEIYFKSIPTIEIRTKLKSNGFRWGKFNKCWYKQYKAGIEKEIKTLLNI